MQKEMSVVEKIQYMEDEGMRPRELEKKNPMFFHNILKYIRPGIRKNENPLNPNNYMWECGNKELRDKLNPREEEKKIAPINVPIKMRKYRKKAKNRK